MLKKVFYFIIGLLLMAIGFNTFLKDLNIVQGVSGIALWNDNSSAVLKQIFLIICLISLDEFEFESNDKIFNYYDFENLRSF